MTYIVCFTNSDKEDEYWGPFESISKAATWAGENLSQWWWINRINDPITWDDIV